MNEKAQRRAAIAGLVGVRLFYEGRCSQNNTKMNFNNYEERKHLYDRAQEVWGVESQENLAIEEMAELTIELIKGRRNNGNLANIIDEIADVKIMMEQLEHAVGIAPVKRRIEYKLNRLANRLDEFI